MAAENKYIRMMPTYTHVGLAIEPGSRTANYQEQRMEQVVEGECLRKRAARVVCASI